ncbi:MAG: CPBP family intramembrane metalloprotease [Deltaproteobacteria bacterium]|nr:CPBP family intramembrane metalloprotease [Deltaproteobacteria bacterium]
MNTEKILPPVEWKILLASASIIFTLEIAAGTAVSKKWVAPFMAIGFVRLLETFFMVMLVFQYGKGLSSIGLAQKLWLKGLKKGFIWSAAFGILTGILFVILYVFQTNPLILLGRRLPFTGQELIFFLLVAGFISPVAEEIFFRGMVFGFLRRWGVIQAVIISTVIFAFIHSRGMNFPLTQIVGGILFAIAYEFEKNLMVPITIHILGNMAIFIIPLLV